MNVAPLSAKDVVRSDHHTQIQIAGLAAVGTGLSLARYANPRSILHPGGDSYFDRIGTQRGAVPLTDWTGASTEDSAPVAGGAGDGLLQSHALRHAGEHFCQRQLYFRFKILALRRKSTTGTGSPSPLEQIFEDVGKGFPAERSLRAVPSARAGLPARLLVGFSLFPVCPILIIFLPFVRIAQHFVRRVQLLELLLHFCFLGAAMEIGVNLPREATIGLLD